MTPQLEAHLREWLVSGDETQRRHAAARLAMVEPIEEYPSAVTMMGNAIKAAGQFIADGFKVVSAEEQERRLAICRECPHYDATQGRCFKCGCVASLKARIRSSVCPDSPPRW